MPGVSRYDASYFGANLCIISITALAMLQDENDPDQAATAQLQKGQLTSNLPLRVIDGACSDRLRVVLLVVLALTDIVTAGYDHLSASFPSHFLAASTQASRGRSVFPSFSAIFQEENAESARFFVHFNKK